MFNKMDYALSHTFPVFSKISSPNGGYSIVFEISLKDSDYIEKNKLLLINIVSNVILF